MHPGPHVLRERARGAAGVARGCSPATPPHPTPPALPGSPGVAQRTHDVPERHWRCERSLASNADLPEREGRSESANAGGTEVDRKPEAWAQDFNYTDQEVIQGFLKYGFNAVISKKLGNRRHVPDTRNEMCLKKHYPTRLPTASIVICFHNEEFHALFRTISSIMALTPHQVLEEIILVDDMSEFDDLKEKLDYHLEAFRGKIKIIRNKKREGLIRARLIGAARASGDVLVFLDSHCEVNKVWLEPLLTAIAEDRRMVVCPMMDSIEGDTLKYNPSPVVRGAFNWYLQFEWDTVLSYEMDGPEGPTTPIRSPVMAGGMFAINRHYFYEIGQFDKEMNFWGGENLELSLRVIQISLLVFK